MKDEYAVIVLGHGLVIFGRKMTCFAARSTNSWSGKAKWLSISRELDG